MTFGRFPLFSLHGVNPTKGGVVPLIDLHFSTRIFRVIGDHGGDDFIEKIAVVGDDNHTSVERGEGVFQQIQGKNIQVIGGLIQQEEIGLLQDKG